MAIPNPNPNIADGIKSDNKTYSSNKIESLITSSQIPVIGEGDEGKVVTVGSDGYELITPIAPESIIDDSAAADDTVYSSNKVNDLLSDKADSSDVDNSSITITRVSGVSESVPLLSAYRKGHTIIINMAVQIPAGTYSSALNGGTWQINVAPNDQYFSVVLVGSSTNLLTVRSNGIIGFNSDVNLNASTYLLGQLTCLTNS